MAQGHLESQGERVATGQACPKHCHEEIEQAELHLVESQMELAILCVLVGEFSWAGLLLQDVVPKVLYQLDQHLDFFLYFLIVIGHFFLLGHAIGQLNKNLISIDNFYFDTMLLGAYPLEVLDYGVLLSSKNYLVVFRPTGSDDDSLKHFLLDFQV